MTGCTQSSCFLLITLAIYSAICRILYPCWRPYASMDNRSAPMGDNTLIVFFRSLVDRPFPFTFGGNRLLEHIHSTSNPFRHFSSCSLLFKPFLLKNFIRAPQKKKQRATKRQPPCLAPVTGEEKFITPASRHLFKDQCEYRNIVEGHNVEDVPQHSSPFCSVYQIPP